MSTDKEDQHWLRRWQLIGIDIALTAAGAFALIAGAMAIHDDNAVLIATCMGTGLVLLFAATIQRFAVLKGLGIEATVAKIDEQVNKAQVSLAQFKRLAETLAPSIISLSSRMGRWDSAPTVAEAFATAMQVKQVLEMSGSAPDEVRTALYPWARVEVNDLAYLSLNPLRTAADSIDQALRAKIDALPSPLPSNDMPILSALLERRRILSDHLKSRADNIPKWEFSEVTRNMLRAISECPELSDEQKDSLRQEIDPTIAEIDYFRTHFAFKDIDYWIRNSRQSS